MAYRLQILVHMMRAEYRQAIDAGLECLRVFGIDTSAHPARSQVQDEYERVWTSLGDRSIESLVELPQMTDPKRQAAMQVLSVLTAPAFFTDSNLFYLIVYKIANLSLSYGTADTSVNGYADLGLILGPVFRRYSEGYRFAKLALNLAEKYGFQVSRGRAYYNMEQVGLWTQPFRTAIDFIRLAFDICIETHDLAYACYCCNHLVTDLLLQGVHLEEVWREAQKGLEFVRKVKYRDVADVIVSQQRFILNLRGRTAGFATFGDPEFDEESFEAQLTDDRMPNMVCWYWILKLQARFLSGDYEAASRAAERAQSRLWSTEAFIESANFYFYHALTIAALADTAHPRIGTLKQHLERLQVWAENCPKNFENRAALVGAEIARLEGRDLDAERLYEQAIRSARASDFVHHEALAYELAACFYAARGFEDFAYVYLRKARYCYLRWGADGKVRQLDEIYPQLRTEEPVLSPTGTIEATPEHFDLATFSRVSQAVSSEIVPEKLIETLLKIALEQAGADRGLLILPQNALTSSHPAKGEHHQIEAEIKSGADHVEVQLRKAPATSDELPDSLLRYVLRTQQHVILDDALVQNLFSEDRYIRQKHPRSVLCLPLVKQTKLMGVLYLENSLTPRVFTPKRLTMLELLGSQAAISLDHARVYAELSRENSDRRKAEEALRASEQRLQDIIDNTPAVITVKDLDLHYLLINREHERRFQVQRDQIRGKTDYDFLPRDVAEKIRINDRQVIASGSPIQFEVTTPMTEGERHYVVVKFLLRDGAGKPYAVCGISTDITERKEAEEARQKAQAELAHVARVATLGELAGSIAHEVKQPLTAIINNADVCLALLPGETSKLEDLREALSDIISDADRANTVIERIRGLIKKAPPRKARLDLNETIGGVIALARGELNSSRVVLRTKLANDLPLIVGDRIHLQQVILNLIINGIEAMRAVTDAPRELWISSEKVGAAPDLVDAGQEAWNPQPSTRSVLRSLGEKGTSEKTYILVSVADSGPGLDLNNVHRLFDAFYTTKPQGLGMGLSISRSIVEAHGGRLWARANVPICALFQFMLPIALRSDQLCDN